MSKSFMHKKRVLWRKPGGFTLVEVLVATVILAAGMTAVLRGFSVAVNGLDSAREVLAATDGFEDKLAELQLSAWPKREPPARDGGTWATPAGSLTWKLQSDTLISMTNATLHRLVLEAVPVGRPGGYMIATEWLDVRGRQ
jgi:prepilin-type N-terminal cleavage/methylation domain-containing protein